MINTGHFSDAPDSLKTFMRRNCLNLMKLSMKNSYTLQYKTKVSDTVTFKRITDRYIC